MQQVIRRNWLEQPTIAKSTSLDEACMADVIAQAYLKGLRKAIPSEAEEPVLFGIPLNLSERFLLSHISRLNNLLCELARLQRWHSCQQLWDEATKLVTVFEEIALMHPDPFKPKARDALFMPSLRVPPRLRKAKARRGKWSDPFLGNAPQISEAISLASHTVGTKLSDNRSQLGAMCARVVGECVQEVRRARFLWSQYFLPYGREPTWPRQKELRKFVNQSQNQLIAGIKWPEGTTVQDEMDKHLRLFCLQAECGVERLHFLLLPELMRETASRWWKGAIERMIDDRFAKLIEQPLWRSELESVSTKTEADMRKELKDYCRDKVKQFA